MGPILDVCVVGGGPAALAAGLALLRSGRDVVILRAARPAPAFGEHLSPGALPVLRRLGAAELLDRPAHRRCPGITSRWGTSHPTRRAALGVPGGLGHVIDRARFDVDLATLLPQRRLVTAGRLGAVRWQGDHWRLDPEGLRARIIVDATGRRAAMARWIGADLARHGRLTAVHAMVEPGAPLPQADDLGVASGRDGWGYSVRLADGRAAACVICDPFAAPKGRADRAAWILHRLTGLGLLSPGARIGHVRVAPCGMQRLHPGAGNRWIAVGDAAFATDPLTGDGLRHALSSGAAAPLILEAGTSGSVAAEDRAYATILTRLRAEYQRERRHADAPFWRDRTAPASLRPAGP